MEWIILALCGVVAYCLWASMREWQRWRTRALDAEANRDWLAEQWADSDMWNNHNDGKGWLTLVKEKLEAARAAREEAPRG